MTRQPAILSTLGRVPASYFVYSAFSFFGNRRGGELPGAWFVRALGDAGRDVAVVRQTLYRMEREGELVARRAGRAKHYAPSSYAHAEIDAGTAKIFERPAPPWDGEWTVVRVGLRTPALANDRQRVVALLAVEGFAQLDANVFVHPRPAADRLREALPARARAEVLIVRGSLMGAEAQPGLVARWRIDELARRYRRALRWLAELERWIDAHPGDREAFLARFAVVFEHLAVAWDDPDLPAQLLPDEWPGPEARRTAARLYERLLPGATRHADAILADALGVPKHRSRTRSAR
jgi:phenylacetic acid degradation operon negative regulatory protein